MVPEWFGGPRGGQGRAVRKDSGSAGKAQGCAVSARGWGVRREGRGGALFAVPGEPRPVVGDRAAPARSPGESGTAVVSVGLGHSRFPGKHHQGRTQTSPGMP